MSHIDITDVVAHLKEEYILPVEPTPIKKVEPNATGEPNSLSEPPTKKQKLTGTNKNRPKFVRAPKSSKLCRSLWCLRAGEDATTKCTYSSCDFSHDLSGFLSAKPQDFGTECHNFRTYGLCPYGLTCRFGSDHIEDSRNKVNQELWSKHENSPSISNVLKKEVQYQLRKRQYDFARSVKAHRDAQSEMAKASEGGMEKIVRVKENEKKPDSVNSDSQIGDNSISSAKAVVPDEAQSEIGDDGPILEEHSEEKTPNGVLKDAAEANGGLAEDNGRPAEDKGGPEDSSSDCQHENGKPIGPAPEEDLIKLNAREKKKIEWRDKIYLAPLTTVGNLPFRRVCKRLGADITCSEMAVATCLLQGSPSEWALVKRHESEDLFGIQLCGSNAETMIKCAQLLDTETNADFFDINMGCPIDLVYKQGGGSALMRRHGALEHMVRGMTKVLSKPLTLKMRTGIYHDTRVAHAIIEKSKLWDVSMITLHGRSREQRYLKAAYWDYIDECAGVADPIPLFGNGDILSYEDYMYQREHSKVAGIMIGRGALIKPWIFTEIKEQRHWDISSKERLDILKEYVNCGMQHWGSDSEGIEKTRRFLLEWLSFLHRYIPVGLLEQTQKINHRPPAYQGRDYLETLMASRNSSDWIKISEMLLGPTPSNFEFLPKHKANSY